MSTQPHEKKYDTLRLLNGVQKSDEYHVEDIMQEFSGSASQAPSEQRQIFINVPLEPPARPAAPEPDARSFFGIPPEIDSLGEDFWSEPVEDAGADALWGEISSMRNKKKVHTAPLVRTAEPNSATPAVSAGAAETAQPKLHVIPVPQAPETPAHDSARTRRRRVLEAEARTPKPDIPADRVVKIYRKTAQSARQRLPFLTLLSLAALYLTLAGSYGWPAPAHTLLCRMLAAAALLGMLLCFDLTVQAIYSLLHRRFQPELLVLLGTLITSVDAFLSAESDPLCYCVIPLLGWLICLWGAYDRRVALRRTARVLDENTAEFAVRSAPELWNGMDCIVRTEGEHDSFLREAERPDYAAQIMQYYVPIAVLGSLLLSGVATLRGGAFLPSLAAILSGATPLAAALCFARPFALLSRRLFKTRSAICGWTGAELLGGRQAVVICDEDLFPEGSVTMNGAKFYNEYDKNYVISCAATILQEAGGDLAPVFESLARDFRTGYGTMTSYRAYEGGGYGAGIGQDLVLIGTVGFMRLMSIPIPDHTNIRQAVYVAINGQLAGLFSINYAPARGSRSGMEALCAQRRLTNLFATRDFILNPSLLRQRFRLSGGRLEFPPIEDRLRLSAPNVGREGPVAALLSHDSFSAYSDTVAGGQQMYHLTRLSSLIALLSGIFGMVIMFVLSYLGENLSATVSNLLIYSVLWALPPILITSWVDKY